MASSEAAQQAFPDSEWAHPSTTAAFREAFDKGAAQGWEAAKAALWEEIRVLPYWRDPETGHHEFDLQPLGPNETSEKSARELIADIFEQMKNPHAGSS